MLEVVDFEVRAYGIEVRVDELRVSGRTVLLGRNGSGKTTLMRAVMGFLRPERGRVLVDGKDVTGLPPEKRPMGYVPQTQVVLPMRPIEQLEYFARLHNADWRTVSERLGLFEALRKEGLSGGERQLLNLATVLLRRPRALVLDEPTSHLDFPNKLLVLRALRSIDVPTLYVTHDPLEAFLLADEIAVLKDGRLEGPERNRMREWAEESFGRFASLYAEMLGSE
jgi:molybdate/tungstate transport system ATP-binding protein